ncbi:hypothetical protein [Amedibacillus dolichus]|uniref:hypothetical protein n=1 Tax=Amedibacillus dolichus TaxID=31971 RepID=UPI00241C76B5|nr:hypothetical protein [Amedibacillus dolichus]
MIYEPEHLKDRKAMYEKREKWLVRFVFSAWALLLFIYVNIAISHVKSTLGFLGIIIGGMVIITVIYFFTMFLILMRRGNQFKKTNNSIVKEFHESKNGELFLERLLAIEAAPKDMNDEMIWYLNIATAFNALGKKMNVLRYLNNWRKSPQGKIRSTFKIVFT